MEKISAGTNVFMYPMPVVLLGTMAGDKPNFMAEGWIARANGSPPMLAVGVNKAHLTPQLLLENKTFSICVPDSGLMEKVDYCGLVSGRRADKSGVFDVFYGELKTAPMIRECPICLECKLARTVDLDTHYLFLGEIVASYTEEKYLTDGKLDPKKIDPLLLTMPDNRYWTIGEQKGKAWSVGLPKARQ